MALRQAAQNQQANFQLGLGSNNADNDSDLSLLARMAANLNKNHQDSHNL